MDFPVNVLVYFSFALIDTFIRLSFVDFFSLFCSLYTERDIKVVRPLYSVEVTETETARFETEISEEDVHGNWKLLGEVLHQSAVGFLLITCS